MKCRLAAALISTNIEIILMNDIVTNRILLFSILICIINVIAFFFVPSIGYTLNLSISFSEPWRFFTFQFFHVDMLHLMENLIGMMFMALIAIELGIDFRSFSSVYFLSVFVVILPIIALFPLATVAGNSTGIYGLLALCLIKARKLLSAKITVPVLFFFIFASSIVNFFQCGLCFVQFFNGEVFHFTGFLTGIALSLAKVAKSKNILKI
jgi:membrane associated rhomboid family serine protease